MAEYSKPLPVPDADTQEYWSSTREHELQAQRCVSCGKLRWPPRGFCPHCYSWEFSWTALRRSGIVTSFVVVHQAIPAFADAAPYTVAHVVIDDTDGAVVLTTTVIDIAPEEVAVGMRVEVVFDDVTPDVTLPRFRPTSSASPPAPSEA